jgi:hypothetical protein
MGIPSGRPGTPEVCAYTSEQLRTSGSKAMGTCSSAASSSSHCPLTMSYISVREALLASVTCTWPPESRCTSHESIVPKASSPFSARDRAPSTWSRSHSSLVPARYGSSTSPVRWRNISSLPASLSSWHRSAVRRSCQTIALWTALPLFRSHKTVVSRWLVMPMPRQSVAATPAFSSASRTAS